MRQYRDDDPRRQGRTRKVTAIFYSISEALLAATEIGATKLTATDKAVLLALLAPIAWKTRRSTLSRETIAKAAGVSRGSVKRSLPTLEAAGLIKIVEDRSNDTGRAILLRWLDDPA